MAEDDTAILRYPCPACRRPLIKKQGRYGWFWGCSGFPECRQTLPDEQGRPGLKPPLPERAQRPPPPPRPAPVTARVGETCPGCGKGALVLRFGKQTGKPYLGCSRFPSCRFYGRIAKK